MAGQGIVWSHALARRLVIREKHSQCPRSELPGEPYAVFRVGNAARKHKVDGRFEKAGILQKERPLLREENLEALVHGDLRLVRLYLRKVRVDGGVQHQRVLEHDLRVEPRPRFDVLAMKMGVVGVAVVQFTEAADRQIWNKLQVAPRRDFLQPIHLGFLRQKTLRIACDVRVERILIVAFHVALEE